MLKKIIRKFKNEGFHKFIKIIFEKLLLDKLNMKKAKKRYKPFPSLSNTDIDQIEDDFKKHGIKLHDYKIDIADYNEFKNSFSFGENFYGGKGNIYEEKILEHFITFDMLKINKHDWYIDIAANQSPYVYLLRKKGYENSYAIDLLKSYDHAEKNYYMVMDATKTSFADKEIQAASMHCAFEMFVKDDDIKLIDELSRILSKNGRVIILPLYMHTHYCGFSSYNIIHKRKTHQYFPENAKVYYSQMKNVPFSRKYDAATLKTRILDKILNSGLDYKIHKVTNSKTINQDIYLRYILEIFRP